MGKNEGGRRLTIWLNKDIDFILKYLKKEYNISFSKIINIGIYQFAKKIDDSHNYKGINLKEYGEILEKRELRKMQSLFRTEHTSKTLFMKRVYRKTRLFLINGATTKEIITLLKNYREEALHYDKPEAILRNLDLMIEKGIEDLKHLKKYKEYYLKDGGKIEITIEKNDKSELT